LEWIGRSCWKYSDVKNEIENNVKPRWIELTTSQEAPLIEELNLTMA
jgi:hypothetical protein